MNDLLTALIILVATTLIGGFTWLAISMFHDTADRDPYHRPPGWPPPPHYGNQTSRAPRQGSDRE